MLTLTNRRLEYFKPTAIFRTNISVTIAINEQFGSATLTTQ